MGSASAPAQSVIDQYVPEIDKGGASTDGGTGPTVSGGPSSAGSDDEAGGSSSRERVLTPKEGATDSQSLPGSDFPLTSFVVILALAVVLALLARLLVPVLRRRFVS